MCCIITVQNSVTANSSLLSPTGGVNTSLLILRFLVLLLGIRVLIEVFTGLVVLVLVGKEFD